MLSDEQLLRYSRHIMLQDVDIDGQEKLLAAKVLIIGLGGLGSPVAMYLAAAGVGHLTLVDFDGVDLSNLQRQIAHTTNRISQNKAQSAAQTLRALNPDVQVTCVEKLLDADTLPELVAQHSIVVDCTDNFVSRFAINAACVQMQIPLVSGAAIRMEGQVTVFDLRDTTSPCYACLYQETDDDLSCAANGVLSPLVGVIGSLQALEVLKLVTSAGQSLSGRVLLFDGRHSQWQEIRLPRDTQCKVCSARG